MLHRPQAWLIRYGIAIITFGIATALALILEPVLEQSHVILFLAAVTASAWLGGVGPGLLVTLLGVLLSA
jgi:K+-sensing histidine kinase KdpD